MKEGATPGVAGAVPADEIPGLPPRAEALVAQRWLVTRLLVRVAGACGAGLFGLFAMIILLAALDPRAFQKELALMGAWALSLALLAAWASIRLKAWPLWALAVLLPLPLVELALLGGLGLEGRDLGMVLGGLFTEGLLLAGARSLARVLREDAPLEKAARWEALSRWIEPYMDGRHPRIARGRASLGTLALGDQLLLRGPDYWLWRPAQFHAKLGVVRDEMLSPEPSEDGRFRLRLWAGSAGLVGRGPQSWVLDFEPAQWAKLAPHFMKEEP